MKKAAGSEGRVQVNSKQWWKYNDTIRIVNKSRGNESLIKLNVTMQSYHVSTILTRFP